MLSSISTLKCFFHHILVLSIVAHCGIEDSNVLNRPFFLSTASLPFCWHDHSAWATRGYNVFEPMSIRLLHPRAIKPWPSLSSLWQALYTHHFCLKQKWCTPGQNFKNKHGIYGPEKVSHSCATPASSLIQVPLEEHVRNRFLKRQQSRFFFLMH